MDDYPLLNLFWTMMLFFLWVMWLFLLFRIVADIFESDDLSGWGKAGWTAVVILLPYVGVLVYVIVRGASMGKRRGRRMEQQEQAFQTYIKQTAGTAGGSAPADQLARFADLKKAGAITDEEFERAKAKILA